MEGVGSRLGRTSSRYGPVSSAPVFSGPVRKWKRQWVLSRPNNTNNNNGRSGGSAVDGPTSNSLFLFRWTPLPSDDDSSVNPPKRKLRYTPVVALEENKRKAEIEDLTRKMNGHSTVSEKPSNDDVFKKMNAGDDFVKNNREPNKDQMALYGKHLDLDLFGKGYDEDNQSMR